VSSPQVNGYLSCRCGISVGELLPHLAGVIAEAAGLEYGKLRIWAHSGTDGAACRRCGQFSARVHSTHRWRWADTPVGGRPVTVWLVVRRFFCGNDDCKSVTFAEQFEGLTTPRARRTPPLARMLTAIGLALAGARR
jgi:zinc-finger of transposase IS204/IS1001/IS1096/IS1165